MKYRINIHKEQAGCNGEITLSVESRDGVLAPETRQAALRPGLLLNVSGVLPIEEAKFQFEIENAPVQFGFILSGANRFCYYDGMLKNQKRLHPSGSNGIYYFPHTSGSIESDRHAGVSLVSILATPDFLDEYLQEPSKTLPRAFAAMIKGGKEQFHWNGTMRAPKKSLLSQILFQPYARQTARLFLESRVLELVAMQVEECLGSLEKKRKAPPRIYKADIERIREARHLLVRDYDSPPGLSALARAVGLNEKKLKYGFKQVYGQPVFEYFRDSRLEHARELLVSGGVTVSEVAYQIGYQSLSHFSRAFRERYGLNPKEYSHLRGMT